MKSPFKDIYTVLAQNRLILLAVIATSCVVCLVSILTISSTHKKLLDSAFVIDTHGSVIPLRLADQREHLEVEVLSHLNLFHQYFYDLEPHNYRETLEKALWLGNSSVSNVYNQKREDGVYNKLVQYSLIHRLRESESNISIEKEPYRFESVNIVEVRRGEVSDYYEIKTSGNLIEVDRNFPKNTHGLLVTNFFENGIRKLEDYENEQE